MEYVVICLSWNKQLVSQTEALNHEKAETVCKKEAAEPPLVSFYEAKLFFFFFPANSHSCQ